MTKVTLSDAAQYLRENDGYLILTHRRPDGDTCGSAAGLCTGLREIGKTAYVAVNPEAVGRFGLLLEPFAPPEEFTPQTVVSVDTAVRNLLPERYSGLNVDFSADHHPGGGAFAAHSLQDPGSAAAGELIFLLLKELCGTVSAAAAHPLYIAIATDTGCLRFESVTSRTLRVAADIKDAGADTAAVNAEYFETKTFSRLALESALLKDVRFFNGGRIAAMFLTPEKVEQTKAQYEDLDNISSLAREISGVDVGIMLRQEKDGSAKASLRTGRGFDAGRICQCLGGGGHSRAAGCTIKLGLERACEAVLNAVYEIYPDLKRSGGE